MSLPTGAVVLKPEATKDEERQAVTLMFADMLEMLLAFCAPQPEEITPEARNLMQLWANWRAAGSPC